MTWYYINEKGEQVGPVSDGEFEAVTKSVKFRGDTMVWKTGLPEWVKYSELGKAVSAAGTSGTAGATMAKCAECGGAFARDEMVNFSGKWVCSVCKPLYVQKLREGVATGSGEAARSKKNVVLSLDGALPHRCIKCNEPVDEEQIQRKVSWHHPAIYLTIFAGLLIYVIIALCCRKRTTVMISVCQKHRAVRRNAILVSWLLALGGIGAIIAGVSMNDSGPLILGGVGAFFLGLIYGAVRARYVYATKITKEYMWLGGCKSAFLADLPEWDG